MVQDREGLVNYLNKLIAEGMADTKLGSFIGYIPVFSLAKKYGYYNAAQLRKNLRRDFIKAGYEVMDQEKLQTGFMVHYR